MPEVGNNQKLVLDNVMSFALLLWDFCEQGFILRLHPDSNRISQLNIQRGLVHENI